MATFPQLALCLLSAGILAGCSSVKPQPLSPAHSATNFNADSLADPGLKQFLERSLAHPLETWPLESWDFPMLTFAALYFHPSRDAARSQWRAAEAHVVAVGGRAGMHSKSHSAPNLNAVSPDGIPDRRAERSATAERLAEAARLRAAADAWLVRACLRTNLLAYVAAQRRQELLHYLESTEMELTQIVEKRLAADATPPVELSLLRLQLAETRLAFIEALQKKMDFRERVADSLGLQVKPLLQVEVTYDFSRTAGYGLEVRDLRRRALQNRPDVLLALADYNAAEAALRLEGGKRHPNTHFDPGCWWDTDKNRWAVNLKPDLPAERNRSPIAKAEARRIKAAAQLLNLQAEVIDELDRRVAVYRATSEDTADIEKLAAAILRQHDAVAARFERGAALRLELLLTRLQLVPAELAQLDAQERLQQALGSLEDTVQQPAEVFGSLAVQ